MSKRLIYGADWPKGTIIEMYGEKFRIRNNHGSSGHVEYTDGVSANKQFFWEYKGDKAVLISLPQSIETNHQTLNIA